jgi:hypothetical protein
MACTAAEGEALEAVTLARSRGDADGIVRELQRHPMCAEVQTRGCQALVMLANSDRDAILRADGIAALEAAVHALRTHLSVDMQIAGLYTTSMLLYIAPAARAHMLTLDTIDSVLPALRILAADAAALVHTCIALGYSITSSTGTEGLIKALDGGALELLVSALVAHSEHAVVGILSPLTVLASHSEAAMQRAVDAGVVDAIVAVMRRWPDHALFSAAAAVNAEHRQRRRARCRRSPCCPVRGQPHFTVRCNSCFVL